MRNIFIIASIFIFFNISISQNSIPSPAIGWDSLKTLIKYPELALRSGLEGYAFVQVVVLSTGEIKNVSIESSAGIFKENIETVIRQTKWKPALKDGKPIEDRVSFPIDFFIKEFWQGPRMIIERLAKKPVH